MKSILAQVNKIQSFLPDCDVQFYAGRGSIAVRIMNDMGFKHQSQYRYDDIKSYKGDLIDDDFLPRARAVHAKYCKKIEAQK